MQTTKRTKYLALIAVFALTLVFSMMSFVLAEDGQNTSVNDSSAPIPTLISANPVVAENASDLGLNESVSGGEIAWKQVKLWFIFNQERKIEGELDLARLRLIQAKKAAENNNSEGFARAMDAHQRIMDRIQERMDSIENVSDSSGLNASATKLIGLERAIQVHERRIDFLSAKLEDSDLTDEQRSKIEDKISKAQNVTAKLSDLQQSKLDKLKTRLMAVANLTDEQANNVLDVIRQNREEKIGEEIRSEDKPENDSERRSSRQESEKSEEQDDNISEEQDDNISEEQDDDSPDNVSTIPENESS